MRARAILRLLACGLAAALGATAAGAPAARAEEPAPPPASRWSFDATALVYSLPEDEGYVMPIVVARRDRLHLEARYNYEDHDTASLFGGYAFATGTKVTFEAIPMLGVVAGRTDGVAPACTLSLAWKQLSVYSENEYVIDLDDSEGNFFYDWTEVTWDPAEWFGVGGVAQRTRVYQSDRDLQRGVMARFARGAITGSIYWFNPGSEDDFAVVSFGAGF